jgi:hypothetical protein
VRRVVNLLALVVLVAVAVGLYRAKSEAGGDRRRVRALEVELAAEQEAVRVMRNEVGYLEHPERLRTLAEGKLGLAPIDPLRVVTLEDAPLLVEPAPQLEASPAELARYADGEGP